MRKTEVLTLLREKEDYLSGQELCGRLGVSRTAVWKIINQLKEEGYEIEAVQNKGYRLLASPDVLGESEIASRLHTKWAGRNLIFRPVTGSTNTDAKKAAEEGAPAGTLVVAEQQEAGRGRRGRGWFSPEGSNLYFTLLLRPDCAPDAASMVTLVMALAAAEAVRKQGLDAGIKWPNDIVVSGKKVCGILTEMSAEPDYIHYVVIGTGMNVNQMDFPEEIARTATSLRKEKGERIVRAALLADVMERFESAYETFCSTWDLSGLLAEYERLLLNKDSRVRVLDPKGEFEGTARGINAKGELIVERPDGRTEYVYAGEVSVRGVYGYV
ncbi:MAG TPA: biotin--[acetyl-CoA-carboxylase] ligase [Candidatus Eisenbergiella merdipullorum]|uniref:Bifunctional ligase/repressor BirA n=1 Tax=Candidatus Eisenbergiella merdipullorum TaxID=2838553 RepID=A0A9D2I6P3_9FIRM|nr:biotin--[acetyl-CoA-carboxylase] ligase [Candidatus Eisenbergiella merdipullorum]